MIKPTAMLLFLSVVGAGAHAVPPVADDLVLADVSACRKPAMTPPPPTTEEEGRFNVRRKYVDLDGSGTCVLLEFWVERLGNSDAVGMRTLGHRFLHVQRGKWEPFGTSLALFPFLLRSPSTGQAYLVVAPDEDIDTMAAGGIMPTAYIRGKWNPKDQFSMETYSLIPVDQGANQIYRALAAQLAKRTPADKQTPAERNRIRALQLHAGDTAAGNSQAPAR